ncbi:superfamily IV 4 TMS phage holin [Sediminihabitans luteus]|uniref:Superfamily IV 4 TMS phage holin n=1 Tax=Sediminihabitans luteus TaxID=1138585 RepID=A0A2M9D048_9CELL|nr:phage holin family protein [Sediminihabitans luteus]PJJ77572.1 superfamily IV 4 TMS phage holin [Sediminihabitans luteus]GII98472.1 hypothetical protein Slu03_08500 [Sediminihabitans luteus]
MIKFLIRTAIFLLAAAIGILLTDWIFSIFDLETFDINWSNPLAFVLAVLIFGAAQGILSPFIAKVARNNAPALLGAVGLVTTYISLLIAWLIASDGLDIGGWQGWIIGPLVVWLVSMLATLLLPIFLVKEGVEKVRENNE